MYWDKVNEKDPLWRLRLAALELMKVEKERVCECVDTRSDMYGIDAFYCPVIDKWVHPIASYDMGVPFTSDKERWNVLAFEEERAALWWFIERVKGRIKMMREKKMLHVNIGHLTEDFVVSLKNGEYPFVEMTDGVGVLIDASIFDVKMLREEASLYDRAFMEWCGEQGADYIYLHPDGDLVGRFVVFEWEENND